MGYFEVLRNAVGDVAFVFDDVEQGGVEFQKVLEFGDLLVDAELRAHEVIVVEI